MIVNACRALCMLYRCTDTDVSTIPNAPSDEGDFPPIWAILLIGKIAENNTK